MRQSATISRQTSILAGIVISAFFFLVPSAAYSYTYQDVQSYLASHPAPQDCKNWTEEYLANGQKGVKVWRKCWSYPEQLKFDALVKSPKCRKSPL